MSTKEKIFACALDLFSKKGFNGVSMRDIAKKVGIKGSSIYNHYAGKKAIMDDICETFVKTLAFSRPPLQEVEQMLNQMDAAELFKSLIISYGKRIDKSWTQMARIIFSEHFYNEEAKQIFMNELIEKNVSYYESVLSIMEQKQKIRACDKHVISVLFNNEQIMLSIQYAHCETDADRAEVAHLMMTSADHLFQNLETGQIERQNSEE